MVFMEPHVHISATHLMAGLAATVAIFGTLHLLSLTVDNPWMRGWQSLGF